MYFGSIVYLYTHAPPGSQFCSVTTTLTVNSFGVGTEGGGGGVVRVVAVGSASGFEWSLKIRMDARVTPPASIAKIASAASSLRRFCIYSPVTKSTRTSEI